MHKNQIFVVFGSNGTLLGSVNRVAISGGPDQYHPLEPYADENLFIPRRNQSASVEDVTTHSMITATYTGSISKIQYPALHT